MKKIAALLLVVMMSLTIVLAAAEGSIGAEDIGRVETPESDAVIIMVKGDEDTEDNGDENAEDAEKDELTALQEEISEFVEESPVAEYFPEEIREEILEAVENTDALEMNELVGLIVKDYQPDMGDTEAIFTFDTPYKVGQKVFPLIGIFNEQGEVKWILIKDAEVLENGDVRMVIPADVMQAMQNASKVVMAVLSEPLAE